MEQGYGSFSYLFLYLVLTIASDSLFPILLLQADVHNVKDAISSAVDVMQAMASSICLLLSKVILLKLYGPCHLYGYWFVGLEPPLVSGP